MVWNWFQQQARNVQSAVDRTARTAARVTSVVARPVIQPITAGIRSATRTVDTAGRVTSVVARPVIQPIAAGTRTIAAAGKDHAAKTEAAEMERAEQRRAVMAQASDAVVRGTGPLVQSGRDFIASPQARFGSSFVGQQVGRKVDLVAAPARAVIPAVPSYEEHFARHPEDVVKGALIGASIALPAGAVGGGLARGGALAAGRLAAGRTAPNVIRTGGGGAGYVTPAKTAIEDVMKIAGAGATLLPAMHWSRPETKTAAGMPTGMPDWMNEWSDPHGGAGYGTPELDIPDLDTDRGERYSGEDFEDYLHHRGELSRREDPVRRKGPTPYYAGPELISGGRTVRTPEIQPGEGILRLPELPTGGRTVRTPEIDSMIEPRWSSPERLMPREGSSFPGDLTAGSAISRTPTRTPARTPARNVVDDRPRYIFGYERPTLAPAREMPDLDTWADTLSRDAARDLDLTFGSAISPPRASVSPRFTPGARLRLGDRPDSIPDFAVDPLSLPDARAGTGARTRTGTGTGTGVGTRTRTRTGVQMGAGTSTTPSTANETEFPSEYPGRNIELPSEFFATTQLPRTRDQSRRGRRLDQEEDKKKKKKRGRRGADQVDWLIENPVHDLESMFGISPDTPKPRAKASGTRKRKPARKKR